MCLGTFGKGEGGGMWQIWKAGCRPQFSVSGTQGPGEMVFLRKKKRRLFPKTRKVPKSPAQRNGNGEGEKGRGGFENRIKPENPKIKIRRQNGSK